MSPGTPGTARRAERGCLSLVPHWPACCSENSVGPTVSSFLPPPASEPAIPVPGKDPLGWGGSEDPQVEGDGGLPRPQPRHRPFLLRACFLRKSRSLTVTGRNARPYKQKKKKKRQTKPYYILIKSENSYKMIKLTAGRDVGKMAHQLCCQWIRVLKISLPECCETTPALRPSIPYFGGMFSSLSSGPETSGVALLESGRRIKQKVRSRGALR